MVNEFVLITRIVIGIGARCFIMFHDAWWWWMMVNGVHWDRGIGKIWWDGIHNSKPIVNHKLTIFHLDTVDGRNNLLQLRCLPGFLWSFPVNHGILPRYPQYLTAKAVYSVGWEKKKGLRKKNCRWYHKILAFAKHGTKGLCWLKKILGFLSKIPEMHIANSETRRVQSKDQKLWGANEHQ